MIEARKSPFFDFLLGNMIRILLRRHFYAHHLKGGDRVKALDRKIPMLFFANHSNWWDGFVAFHLTRDLWNMDTLLMMDVKQLSRYRFFRRIGAFSVDRENPREAQSSIDYAVRELVPAKRVLWMYPQGVMAPNDKRPLGFYAGLAKIAHALGEAWVVPVAHRYEFLGEQRPEIFTSVGPPRRLTRESPAESKRLTEALERELTATLDGLREHVAGGNLGDFQTTFRGRVSIHAAYDRLRGR
jgi:chlorobactene lauroyltransferase